MFIGKGMVGDSFFSGCTTIPLGEAIDGANRLLKKTGLEVPYRFNRFLIKHSTVVSNDVSQAVPTVANQPGACTLTAPDFPC